MDIDVINFKYIGIVTIQIEIDNISSNEIILDSDNLIINDILIDNNKCYYQVDNDKKKIFIHISELNKNNQTKLVELKIFFENKIGTNLNGIYYTRVDDDTIILTQLEPNYAQRVFPCFDDPNKKATFQTMIKTNSKFTCLSNTRIQKHDKNEHHQLVIFDKTPIMSTYLFCIVIGTIEPTYSESINYNGVLINGYSLTKQKKLMQFAVEHTIKSLKYFEEWFDQPYALNKLDIVAVPNFEAGAMENWGLITFREVNLLCDDHTTDLVKIKILEVIYHEMSHQWFGNLVTMSTWADLWLNESCATFFSWMAMANIYPEYDPWSIYNIFEYQKALYFDSFESTHPIKIKKVSDDIHNLFDEITYCKGSSVIKYIYDLVGKEIFQKSIVYYLKKYKFSNTKSQDFVDAFGKFYKNHIVDKLFEDIIEEKGFPIIIAKINGSTLTLEKKRYCIQKQLNSDYLLNFIVHIVDKTNDKYIVFDKKSIIVEGISENFIIDPNVSFLSIILYETFPKGTTMPFKINYIFTCLQLYLSKKIDIKNYIKIINEILLNSLDPSYLLVYNEIVISSIKLCQISTIDTIFIEWINIFCKMLIDLILYYCDKPKVYYLDAFIHNCFILMGYYLNNKNITNVLLNYYDSQTLHNNSILIESVLKVAIKKSPDIFDNVLNLYHDCSNVHLKLRILSAILLVPNKELFMNCINQHKQIVRQQDITFFFVFASLNKKYQNMLVDWIVVNLSKHYNNKEQYKILKSIAPFINRKQSINRLTEYIKENNYEQNIVIDILDFNVLHSH
jgi:hypothetical protein